MLWLLALVVIVAEYERLPQASAWLAVKIQSFVLDARLLASSYLMYLKISRELKSIGLTPPKFRYTPIQERSDV